MLRCLILEMCKIFLHQTVKRELNVSSHPIIATVGLVTNTILDRITRSILIENKILEFLVYLDHYMEQPI